MSLMWTLRKFVDPLEWRKESEEKRAARELVVEQPNDGGGGPAVARLARPAEEWTCRICAYESAAGDYCPTCLADTMQPRRRS